MRAAIQDSNSYQLDQSISVLAAQSRETTPWSQPDYSDAISGSDFPGEELRRPAESDFCDDKDRELFLEVVGEACAETD